MDEPWGLAPARTHIQKIKLTANYINRGEPAENIRPEFAEFRSDTGNPKLA